MNPRNLLILSLLIATSLACSPKRPLREELTIPAVDATRLSAAPLPEVDERKRPPKWIDHEREDGDQVYGVGVVKGRGNRDVDLYRVQEAAERSVSDWLRRRGMLAEAPQGLYEPLDVELRAIHIEEIAHNKKSDTWYCLARLDRDAEGDHIKRQVKEVNESLSGARKGLKGGEPEEQVAAALSVLFGLDRRAQYHAQFRALTGKVLDPPRKLRDRSLDPMARDALAAYGVRVVVDGPAVDGLQEAVEATLERFSLRPDPQGEGQLQLRLSRRRTSAQGRPFVYLDGEMRIRLEGESGPARTVALHAKGSGSDMEEAEVQAAHRLGDDIRSGLIDTLRRVAGR